jgi:dihydrofolate reductase
MILKGSVNIAVSVDGFIATKDGNLDWLNNQPMVEGEDFGFSDFLKSVNVMIMGRNTFDTVVSFGPEAWAYGDLPIFVWTRNVANVQVPDWVPATVTVRSSSSPKELWNDVQKNQKYTHAYVDGGKTIQSFLKAGLIHRLTLTRIPILLGDGIPLFGGVGLKQSPLQHISTKSYSNGFVISTYDVAYGNDESCPSAEETS